MLSWTNCYNYCCRQLRPINYLKNNNQKKNVLICFREIRFSQIPFTSQLQHRGTHNIFSWCFLIRKTSFSPNMTNIRNIEHGRSPVKHKEMTGHGQGHLFCGFFFLLLLRCSSQKGRNCFLYAALETIHFLGFKTVLFLLFSGKLFHLK